MKCLIKNSLYVSVLVAVLAIGLVQYSNYTSLQKLAKLELWAEQNKIVVDRTQVKPEPFQVEFKQDEWDYLLEKLQLTRYFEPLDEKLVKRYL
jgi:hypothetical protein